jgi:hypothetical protein
MLSGELLGDWQVRMASNPGVEDILPQSAHSVRAPCHQRQQCGPCLDYWICAAVM